jgi:hypothetical protein
MELMRHSEISLTMKNYTDPNLLPSYQSVSLLPDFQKGGPMPTEDHSQTDAQIHSQELGGPGLPVSRIVADQAPDHSLQLADGEEPRHTLSPFVAEGPESEKIGRCRVRTYDFHRVKVALYH